MGYASYETPDVATDKLLYNTLRGFTRIQHLEFYSIFERVTEDLGLVEYVVAIRGTYVLDARDLWEDVLIAFKNDASGRKEHLSQEIRTFLDSIIKKHEG